MSEGWRSVPLLEAGTWLSGGTPSTDEPRYWGGDIPWISAASLKDFRITRSDRCVTYVGALNGTRLVPGGTVLFVVRGMSLKSEFRVGVTEREVAFGQDCKAILPAPGIDARFLAFALKARERDILAMVDEAGHGTGRLPTDLIAKLEISVPKLAEQQRIVEVLHAADSQIDQANRHLDKHAQVKVAMAEALIPVTPDPHELGPGWSLLPLAEVVPSAAYGISTPLEYVPGGLPVLRMNNLQAGRMDLSDVKAATSTVPANLMLKDHDVLFNRTNSLEHVGKTAMWRGELAEATFASYMVRLNVAPARITPEYLARWLNIRAIQQRIRRVATPAIAQVNINPTALRKNQIELPADLSEQRKITSILDSLDEKGDRLQVSSEKLKLLRKGLLEDLLTGRIRMPAR